MNKQALTIEHPTQQDQLRQHWQAVRASMSEKIIGQDHLVNRILIALLADGHLLVEGAPGLAKTRAIRTLTEHIDASFHRVQFTPDLLPADITGTEIYRSQLGNFEFQPGPIFHNLILADEINRAPAKVQSALLEAMAERQVSVGKVTHPLPPLFMVMATQNPIEQEGTYPLPEAQLDRFLMHVTLNYPDLKSEQAILKLAREEAVIDGLRTIHATSTEHRASESASEADITPQTNETPSPAATHALDQSRLFESRQAILTLDMVESVEQYIVDLIMATRHSARQITIHSGQSVSQAIEYGISPRGTISLDRCARAHAWLAGRNLVTPSDVQAVAADVMRHRFTLSFEAEARGISKNEVILSILNAIPAP
ncbi:MAG: AAA family ATPase [Gammaproteobacteria bacterium]